MSKKYALYFILTSIIGLSGIIAIPHQNASAETVFVADPSVPEIHIGKDGRVTIVGMKVMQVVNTTLFTRTSWSNAFIRWTIKTDPTTDIRKRHGDKMSIREFKEGDYLSAEGYIEGNSALSIVATKLINWSDYTVQSAFSGSVKSIDIPEKKFTLSSTDKGELGVNLTASTSVYRNDRVIHPRYIRVGDSITSIEGTYNTSTKQMESQKINIKISQNIFTAQNYQGILETLPSKTAPVTFSLKIGTKSYKIILADNPIILNKARQSVTFDRFLVGDTVRIWGYIPEDNDELDTIRAEIVRDINF